MASKAAQSRLKKELKRLNAEPVPHVHASPLPNNILEWHYAIQGPSNTPFEGGIYHGKLKFPTAYPNKPPSILMLTPNGRFATNTRICMSMSDFHPETWNPMWDVGSILTGLVSFMLEDEPSTGCVVTTADQKRHFARESGLFNTTGPFSKVYKELFSDVKPIEGRAAATDEAAIVPDTEGRDASTKKPEVAKGEAAVRVKLTGLSSAALNGRTGVRGRLIEETGRYEVTLDGPEPQRVIAVKLEKLQIV